MIQWLKRRRLITALLAVSLTAAGALLFFMWPTPVPAALAGEWENVVPVGDIPPGELRLVVRTGGTVSAVFDRQKYYWPDPEFRIKVKGDEILYYLSFKAEPELLRFELKGDRLSVWNPDLYREDRTKIGVFRRLHPR